MNNVALENVKDFAFLANKSYDSEAEMKSEQQKNKDAGKNNAIYNDTTNFGFSGTVFKNTETNEYVIAFRGTDDGEDLLDDAIMEK